MLCAVRALAAWVCSILVATAVIAAAAGAKPAGPASCPLKPGVAPTGGDVQWAFTESGPPTGKRHGISTSYTHGRGNWTSGRATGKACGQDKLTAGAQRNLVLAVTGKSKLTGRVKQFGLLGVRLVLPLRVSASDDSACPVGSRGTATLFASYFSIHRDSVALHFGPHCTGHNHNFGGSQLHVLITRHGAQVNTP